VTGDIGLLEHEKNYMIVVTKEGKLITLDFNSKTKATEIKETKVKMAGCGARVVRKRGIRHQGREELSHQNGIHPGERRVRTRIGWQEFVGTRSRAHFFD